MPKFQDFERMSVRELGHLPLKEDLLSQETMITSTTNLPESLCLEIEHKRLLAMGYMEGVGKTLLAS